MKRSAYGKPMKIMNWYFGHHAQRINMQVTAGNLSNYAPEWRVFRKNRTPVIYNKLFQAPFRIQKKKTARQE